MTLTELAEILTAIPGFAGRVSYYAFPEQEAPDLPFITYLETGSNNFAADNRVYYKGSQIDIELYTEHKDEATEGDVESALDAAELVWVKSDDYLEDENCWMIVYTITI